VGKLGRSRPGHKWADRGTGQPVHLSLRRTLLCFKYQHKFPGRQHRLDRFSLIGAPSGPYAPRNKFRQTSLLRPNLPRTADSSELNPKLARPGIYPAWTLTRRVNMWHAETLGGRLRLSVHPTLHFSLRHLAIPSRPSKNFPIKQIFPKVPAAPPPIPAVRIGSRGGCRDATVTPSPRNNESRRVQVGGRTR
jgi:hypothetical protein